MKTFPGHTRVVGAIAVIAFACAASHAIATTQQPAVAAKQPTTLPAKPQGKPIDLEPEVRRCSELIGVDGPSSSSFDFDPMYPPFDAKWNELAKDAWDKNANARRSWREVRLARANHPLALWANVDTSRPEGLAAFNRARSLANELSDAALYADSVGNLDESVALIEDLMFLADATSASTDASRNDITGALVGVGIRALAWNAINAIAPRFEAAKREVALDHIARLRDRVAAEAEWAKPLADVARRADDAEIITRLPKTLKRMQSESRATLVGLDVQAYRLRHNRWPASERELASDVLPEMPADPSGEPGDRIRYVLVRNAQPLGVDRPIVVYRNDEAPNGGEWLYRTDRPFYGYSVGDGSNRRLRDQQRLVQARDVSRWTPREATARDDRPATAPLPVE